MPNIRTRFVAEGEKEYRQALGNINGSLNILNAESKRLQEQFKGNEDSLEALTATNKNLNKIVGELTKKQELQQERLKKLTEAYGENDARTMRMAKAVKDTEAALLKQKRALEESKDAVENFGQKESEAEENTQDLGDALNDVGGKFGISLPKEMTNTLNGMLKIDTQTLVTIGTFAALAAAVAEVEKALISLTIESAAYADEILTQSVVTGLSAEALQEYQYAAELVDVSLDTLTSSQAKMIRSMDAARRGSKEQAEAFDKLGISVQNADGTLRDAQDVFGDAIDALGAISNETERDAIAMTIFGRSARDLNPLIKAGSDGLHELTQEAHNVGYVMGEEALDALGAVDDQLQRMNRSGEALKNQIAVGMAPAVENLMKKGTDLFVRLQEAAEGSGILEVFGALLDVVSALEPLFDVLFGTAEDGVPVLQTLALALGVLADALTIVANTIAIVIELFKQLFNLISGKGFDDSNLTRYGENIAKVFSDEGASARAWNNGFGRNIGRNADGTDYWPGGLTWVGERGPELVSLPQGSRVYSAEDSRSMGGTNNYYLTVQSRDMETVAAMTATFKRARQAERAK
nr:MAG TPA: tail tape measure [Caudoviricetes sp.]